MAHQYDVYGVGNALVDMVYEVEESVLGKLKVDKGVMTLVDEARQKELLNQLSELKAHRASGGSAANSMIAVAQFGGKSFYSCKVANDEAGDFFMHDLSHVGVESNLRKDNREEGTTGKCLVIVTPDADRTMNTYLGITSELSPKELVEDALKLSKWVYLEGYLMPSPSGKQACIDARNFAKANKVKVSLTLSDPNMAQYFRDAFKEVIGDGVDLLFSNEEEAKIFTEKPNVQEAAEELKKYASTFAVTLGGKGSLVWDGDRLYQVDATQVKAIDTNGAGDMFAGAFLYAISHGADYLTAARAASHAAGQIVSQFGPRLQRNEATQTKSTLHEMLGLRIMP